VINYFQCTRNRHPFLINNYTIMLKQTIKNVYARRRYFILLIKLQKISQTVKTSGNYIKQILKLNQTKVAIKVLSLYLLIMLFSLILLKSQMHLIHIFRRFLLIFQLMILIAVILFSNRFKT
jgi:hypothetical protein